MLGDGLVYMSDIQGRLNQLPKDSQQDRSSGLPLMQVFCVVGNEAPGFAPLPLPLA